MKKAIKLIFFLFILLTNVNLSMAQTSTLFGLVLDKTDENFPIPQARIILSNAENIY